VTERERSRAGAATAQPLPPLAVPKSHAPELNFINDVSTDTATSGRQPALEVSDTSASRAPPTLRPEIASALGMTSRATPGKRAKLRTPPGGKPVSKKSVPNRPLSLEETLEILGAGELQIESNRRDLLSESAVRDRKRPEASTSRFGRLINRLAERLGNAERAAALALAEQPFEFARAVDPAVSRGTQALGRGRKKSQKFACCLSLTSSAVGSRQCLATRSSYSTHIRHTCSSARQRARSSRRDSGRVRRPDPPRTSSTPVHGPSALLEGYSARSRRNGASADQYASAPPGGNLRRGALGDDAPATRPGLGTHVDDPVGFRAQIEVVFDHDDRIAGVHQAVQHAAKRPTSAMCRPTVGSSST
jgi:hypothetical protein